MLLRYNKILVDIDNNTYELKTIEDVASDIGIGVVQMSVICRSINDDGESRLNYIRLNLDHNKKNTKSLARLIICDEKYDNFMRERRVMKEKKQERLKKKLRKLR